MPVSYSLNVDGISYVGTEYAEWRAMMQRVDAGLDPNDTSAAIPEEQAQKRGSQRRVEQAVAARLRAACQRRAHHRRRGVTLASPTNAGGGQRAVGTAARNPLPTGGPDCRRDSPSGHRSASPLARQPTALPARRPPPCQPANPPARLSLR